jgi:glycosyltransferase involved in cell wall biosynthesis
MKNHFKILYVVSDYASPENPSFQPFVRSQIESVARLGHDIYVYSVDGPRSGKNYITRIPNLIKHVSKLKPDIVHAHYAYCGFTALGTVGMCPLVTSIMGDEVLGRFEVDGRKMAFSYAQYPLAKLVVMSSKRVIVKSREMAKHSLSYKTYVIPNGVDFSIFRPRPSLEVRQELGLDTESIYLLFPCDPKNTVKRFELAVKVSQFLNRKYGLANTLLHMRDKSQADLVKYMNAANAMVFTSWSEGSPNVVKEAMACNLPIVSVPVGDVLEILDGTDNCAVVWDDPKIMAESLHRIISNGQRSTGRDRIRHLRMDKVALRIERVYHEVMRA